MRNFRRDNPPLFALQISRTASPVEESMMGSAQQTDKPYKPKFHKAVLYNSHEQPEDEIRNIPISACANNNTPSSSNLSSIGGALPKGPPTLPSHHHQQQQPPPQQQSQLQPRHPVPTVSPSATANVSAKLNAFPANHVPPRLSHLVSWRGQKDRTEHYCPGKMVFIV